MVGSPGGVEDVLPAGEEELEQQIGSTLDKTGSCISCGRTGLSFGFGSDINLFLSPRKLKSDTRRFKIGA